MSNYLRIPERNVIERLANIIPKEGSFVKEVAVKFNQLSLYDNGCPASLFCLASLARIIKIKNRTDSCAAVFVGQEKLLYAVKSNANPGHLKILSAGRIEALKLLKALLSQEERVAEKAYKDLWKLVFENTFSI